MGFKGGKRWRWLDEWLRWVGMEGCIVCLCCWDRCFLGVLLMEVSLGINGRIVDMYLIFFLFFMWCWYWCILDCGLFCYWDIFGCFVRYGWRIN